MQAPKEEAPKEADDDIPRGTLIYIYNMPVCMYVVGRMVWLMRTMWLMKTVSMIE